MTGPAETAKTAVREQAPDLLVNNLLTLEQITQAPAGLFLLRMAASLTGCDRAAWAGVAMIGAYGLAAYGVTRREREFGVRIALGAEHCSIRRMVLGEAVRMVALGVALGAGGALVARKGVERLLVGVGGADPVTYLAVIALMAAVVLVASYIPARAVERVNPAEALRTD